MNTVYRQQNIGGIVVETPVNSNINEAQVIEQFSQSSPAMQSIQQDIDAVNNVTANMKEQAEKIFNGSGQAPVAPPAVPPAIDVQPLPQETAAIVAVDPVGSSVTSSHVAATPVHSINAGDIAQVAGGGVLIFDGVKRMGKEGIGNKVVGAVETAGGVALVGNQISERTTGQNLGYWAQRVTEQMANATQHIR